MRLYTYRVTIDFKEGKTDCTRRAEVYATDDMHARRVAISELCKLCPKADAIIIRRVVKITKITMEETNNETIGRKLTLSLTLKGELMQDFLKNEGLPTVDGDEVTMNFTFRPETTPEDFGEVVAAFVPALGGDLPKMTIKPADDSTNDSTGDSTGDSSETVWAYG